MKFLFLSITGALVFTGCATMPSKSLDYEISSERRLVYTDDLVRSRGRVFVAHGGRASGNYPSDDELAQIRILENALRKKGFMIADTREDAEYRLVTDSNLKNGMFPNFSCRLNRYIRSHRDIIKYAGMTELQMWTGEIRIDSPNVENPQQYEMAAYRRLIELMPNQTSSRNEAMTNLEN